MSKKDTDSKRVLRRQRVRASVKGTSDRPRLSVHVSLRHINAQIIDDTKGVSLASATTVGKTISGSMTDKAVFVGQEIAKSAKKAKVTKVVFDRNYKLYHGRVKALADAARESGLEF
jgi:large subunit ribosomal protein L18